MQNEQTIRRILQSNVSDGSDDPEGNYFVTKLLPEAPKPSDYFERLTDAIEEAASRGPDFGVWNCVTAVWVRRPTTSSCRS